MPSDFVMYPPSKVGDVVSGLVSLVEDAAKEQNLVFSSVVVGGYVRNPDVRNQSFATLQALRPAAPHDVNVYFFVSEEARLHDAICIHGAATREAITFCAQARMQLIIDSHPFVTPTYPVDFAEDRAPFLQLTTNVFSTSDLRQRIPWHCSKSWYSGYETLIGPDPFAVKRSFPAHRDAEWLIAKARALVDYHNVLRRLQFGVGHGPCTTEILFHQAYLYLWEVIKDGLGIALTNEEFAAEQEGRIRDGSTGEIEMLFQDRFAGADRTESCALAVSHARRMKAEYFNLRHDRREAQLSIRLGMDLCECVYARLVGLLNKGDNVGAVEYVRAISNLSLWY